MAFKVFTRTWWRKDEKGKLVPNPRARRTHIRSFASEAAARDFCREWNAVHNPGPFSRKAEYTEV